VNVQGQDAGGPFEPKTSIHADVEDSRDSDKEEEEEEDLVRFEDIISAASCAIDALEALRMSCNVSNDRRNESFPFHLIQGVTHLCLQHELSPKQINWK